MNRKWKWMLVLCLTAMLFAAVALGEVETLVAADQEKAVALLRQQLVARNEEFILLVPGQGMDQDAAFALYQEALEHTGSPKEGDYLRAHMIDCIPEIGNTKVLGKEYVQLHYKPNYKSTAAMEQEVDAAVEAFFATYPVKEKGTQYEKIEAVYDYLCDTIIYDDVRKIRPFFPEQYTQQEMNVAYTTYAGLVEGTAVCEGYASAFYRLMLELGIDVRLVYGIAGEAHAWNLVELDGQYYYVDATWDATNFGWFDNFLQPSLWMHEPESEYLSDYLIAAEAYAAPEKEIFTSGDYTYSVTYGARIHKYNGNERDVVVPQTMDGYPVVSIVMHQWITPFDSWDMVSVRLPEGLRHIRNGCFTGGNLTEIYLPSTCMWNAQDAMWVVGTPLLAAIHIPEANISVKTVDGVVYTKDGTKAIQCPMALEADCIVIPDGTMEIGMCAFRGCTKIRKVVLPESLTTIGGFCFEGATALEEINIPSACTHLDALAFSKTALKELHLPVGLTYLDGGISAGATQMKTITMPKGNETYYVEDDCLYKIASPEETWILAYPAGKEATHFTVPDGVTEIIGYAFNGSKLEGITLNEGLKTIRNDVFSYSAIREITLPASVSCVDVNAFSECYNLASITALNDEVELFEGSLGWYFEGGPAKPTLRGHAGSAIETFATTYDFPFEVIE